MGSGLATTTQASRQKNRVAIKAVKTKNRKKARRGCGKAAKRPVASHLCSASTRLRLPAQGCEARATLGNCREKLPTPTGFRHTQRYRSQPRWGCKNAWIPAPKVAPNAFGATLVFGTQPPWGWGKPDLRPAASSIKANAQSPDQTHSAPPTTATASGSFRRLKLR